MMKFKLTLFSFLIGIVLSAQKNNPPTDAFTINGKVKQEYTFSIKNIPDFPATSIVQILIPAHLSSASINFFCFNVFFIALSLTTGSVLCIKSKYSVGTTCHD